MVIVAFPKLSKGKIGKTITLIGSLTFGIYLFDPYLKTIFYRTYQVCIENHLPTIIASINWVLTSTFVGGHRFHSKKSNNIKKNNIADQHLFYIIWQS